MKRRTAFMPLVPLALGLVPSSPKLELLLKRGLELCPALYQPNQIPFFRLPVLGDCPRHYRPIFDLDLALDDEL